MEVTADVLGTIQFQTSKPDVLIRLSILDQEKEVTSNTGKGHVVIPLFYFRANKGEQPLGLVIEVIDKWNPSGSWQKIFQTASYLCVREIHYL